MSKINKIRIINLNYNNNNIKVDDLDFFLDSEDTMFNLRNGGGKSVLVQMIMAPLVHKKYRTLKERKFDSYFTQSSPTYILIEWKLDDNATYVLTGMMVKKRDRGIDDDLKESLDIINFIYEYKGKNNYDIDNIPIIEKVDGKKRIKSFANTKKLFDDIKRSFGSAFSHYDMNNSSTSKVYFDKLLTYDINYKEWEEIIHKINLKESGLSELFSKSKNNEGLLKYWFLPTVEEKLNKGEDRIKNFRSIINSYINQYKENESKIEQKQVIELFNNISEDIEVKLKEVIDTRNKKDALENEIANIRGYLDKEEAQRNEQEEKLDETIYELQGYLNEIKYEEISLELYKKEKKKYLVSEELNKLNEEKNVEEKNLESLNREKSILECSKIYADYTNIECELQEFESKREIALNTMEDSKSNINNIGFSIKSIIEEEIGREKPKKLEKENQCKCIKEKIRTIKEKLEKNNKYLQELRECIGGLNSDVQSFDKEENRFNSTYNEELSRNIEGFYQGHIIQTLEKNIFNSKNQYEDKYKSINENLNNKIEDKKLKESKKENVIKSLTSNEGVLKEREKSLRDIELEIENRKSILKYVDLDEKHIFNSIKIIDAFEDKIKLLKIKEKDVNKKVDSLEEEIKRLQTGKLLELPREIENELINRGINPVYGMEWLKRNGYSEEKNLEMINKNPFIPYALIMDSKELELLSREPLSTFTSTPILIIKRENLTRELEIHSEGIVNLEVVEFLVSFNKKLLNEEELKLLIDKKSKELKELKAEAERFTSNIKLLVEKEAEIAISKLTKEGYEGILKEIDELKNQCENLNSELSILIKSIKDIEENLRKLEDERRELKTNIDNISRKEKDFNNFKEEYSQYVKSKEKLKEKDELKQVIERTEIDLKRNEKEEKETLRYAEEGVNSSNKVIEGLEKERIDYLRYDKGSFMKKDKADLIARYKALNSTLHENIKEIDEKIKELNKRYSDKTGELKYYSEKLNLIDEDYICIKYTTEKMKEVDNLIENQNKLLYKNNSDVIKCTGKLNKIEAEIDQVYKELKKECKREAPKSREDIVEKDYEQEYSRIEIDIKDIRKEKDINSNIIKKIGEAISTLKEYSDFTIKEEVSINLDIKTLSDDIGIKRRDLRNLADKERSELNTLENEITRKLLNNKVFMDNQHFKDPVETIFKLASIPRQLLEQLKVFKDAFKKQMDKLAQDINLIKKEEEKILENILEYIKEVNENLGNIDNNSSIYIKNRSFKMLNIIVPKWDENQEIYKMKLKEYIHQLREQAMMQLRKNESIEDLISSRISNYNLFNEVVSVSSVNIKLYKIEEDRQRQISWNEVATNSGGEGFLSAFVILSSLLSYIRKDSNDIFNRMESGKVLVMDNPFAQTSSEHLLKPLMEIAKKSNTQLICFTALGDDAIYNRFENIYVLNTRQSILGHGIKYMTSKHVKGKEEEENNEEIMVASRFKIEEQIKLF
ncbi:Chromosome segregation ATPase [Clostridium collagenovorans DSM 3089]|uniref:Chromosome segregation ATPase n=1 Tax=Clostridium collagenovorans DSM 3089 TaxID=1121306 RepID=A0A1M5VB77_9CLOT|nr:hypothetical protein [Clostridium collagenovorans]SHH72499.1 Chromosome segregation ATPase [Clostridium collagenovorans DSM 3089]